MENLKERRWKQRFSNFEKAYKLFKEAIENYNDKNSKLEKEGIIQRFEYTFELAWKTLKDYLEYGGILVSLPREIIKQSFSKGLISDGDAWVDMLEKRNLIAHTYDEKNFEIVINLIKDKYFKAVNQVYEYLLEKNKK